MRKILIFMFLITLLLIPLVSALEWDNLESYDKEEKKITIYNLNIIGKIFNIKLAEYKLIHNTYKCMEDCSASGTATLYKKGILFRKFDTRNFKGELVNIKEHHIYIDVNETYQVDTPIYKEICVEGNETGKGYCYKIIDSYKKEDKERTIRKEYNGEVLEEGNYNWYIFGKKDAKESVDWAVSMFGISTNEIRKHWANWTTADCKGTGGTTTIDGDYCVHTFLTNASFNTTSTITDVTILVVAGGGGGGSAYTGGGGGAGGLIYNDTYIITGNVEVSVGEKGIGGIQTGNSVVGSIGGNSIFDTLLAYGGGGGGSYEDNATSGGSGGGDYGSVVAPRPIATGVAGQGNDGGDGSAGNTGAGGGGAVSIGVNGTVSTGGDGGAGLNYSINGSNVYYAGGGGGSIYTVSGSTYGIGGSDIGGDGSTGQGLNAVAYTGSGGGGSERDPSLFDGGNGSSGIVIVRYLASGENDLAITLNSPINYYNSTSSLVTFNCSATDGVGVVNLTLIINGVDNYTITNTSAGQNLSLQAIKTISDGDYNWTCRGSDGSGVPIDPMTATTRYFTIDSIPPTINVTYPLALIDHHLIDTNLTLNWTVNDTHLDSCWYNYNSTNTTLTCSDNTTQFNITTYENRTIIFYVNDSFGNLNSENKTWDYKILEYSKTYNPTTISGALEQFDINFSYSSLFTGINVLFHYNNTNYTMSTSASGYTRNYTKTITAPSVSAETNKSFHFIFILSNSSGTYNVQLDSINQSVSPFLIDDCSSYTNPLLDFVMYDENNLSKINGTINVNMNIYSYNTENLVNSYNNSFDYLTTASSRICLMNITQNYSMAYKIQFYGNDSLYFKKYKTIQRATIKNDTIPQNISLYNLKLTKGYPFKITVVGNLLSSTANEDLLVDTQRQYLAENLFRSIESAVTDDEGETLTHLIQNSEVYNFIISYYGTTLGTFNNYRVQCSNPSLSQCSITLNLASSTTGIEDFENYGNIEQTFLLDTTTNTLYQTFSSTDGESKSVNGLVIKADGYGNTTICNNSVSGTSGTLTCSIPAIYQNTSFFVQTSVDGEYVGAKYFSQGVVTDWKGANIFIGLLMLSSLVLLFIGHPITIVIGAILGFTMPVLLLMVGGLSFATVIGALFYYIGAGVIILIVLGRKR